MANLASALKEEIVRLARREIRQQTAAMARTVAQCEREIAALKRQIAESRRKPSGRSAPGPAAGGKEAGGKKTVAAAPESGSGQKSSGTRFSAEILKAHRKRLDLSADSYGKLIGVSGLSIYNWEQGKAQPRESSIAALMSVRGIGKREAARRLGESAAPKAKARAKTGAKTKAKLQAQNGKTQAGEQDAKES